jgi:hypothetical protein
MWPIESRLEARSLPLGYEDQANGSATAMDGGSTGIAGANGSEAAVIYS